ncbi:MAG: 30S ribosomal protein S5 [Zetaproteobacteria bacterium]|nr:MAG: 30S ribosomal protein S5 [Zetaproteobacteria bacterium]
MIDPNELDLQEKLVHINRVSKTVAGGRRMGFTALMVVGDGQGHVGFGHARAKEVPDAIRKATEIAKRSLIRVPLNGTTIHFEVIGRQDATRVLLKPASEGTGVIAGSVVRAVMDAVGIRDVLTKVLGSRNPINTVRATFNALMQLEEPEAIMARRGKRAA